MLALRATSDELEKYPMVKDNLHAYAGPQCFPHLDPKSPEYRVHANQKLKTESVEDGEGASAADKQQVARAAVVKEQCWLQCDRCGKHRCVAEACLPVLRGYEFFEARVTDLDWERWLSGAPARYGAAEAAQELLVGGVSEAIVDLAAAEAEVDSRGLVLHPGNDEGVTDEGSMIPQRRRQRSRKVSETDAETGSVAAAVTAGGAATGEQSVPTQRRRRRLSVKISETDAGVVSVAALQSAGGSSNVRRRVVGESAVVHGEASRVNTAALLDDAASVASDPGVRSASEHECASGADEDRGESAAVAAVLGSQEDGVAEGVEAASRGGRLVVDRSARNDDDVGLLMDRLAHDKGVEAHAFFVQERAAARLRVTEAEKRALLEGWVRRKQRLDKSVRGRVLSAEVESALAAEREPDAAHGRLAWTLLELKRRAGRLREDVVEVEKDCLRLRRSLLSDVEKEEAERERREEAERQQRGGRA